MNCKNCMFSICWSQLNQYLITAFIDEIDNISDSIKSMKISNNADLNQETNLDVTGVCILEYKELIKIPNNLTQFFPNMIALDLSRCGLKKIEREDLKNLINLREIQLCRMEIENLPGDLFMDLKNIEVIELQNNKIQLIGRETFQGLEKLKFVDLRGNSQINAIFAGEEFEIEEDLNVTRLIRIDELHGLIQVYFHSISKCDDGEKCCIKNVCNDISNLLKSDEYRDFTVSISDVQFKVHKFILIARSPTFADMIRNNPEAEYIQLHNVAVEVFEIILEYIYNDKIPQEYDNYTARIYAAAGKLKLEPLKMKVGKILCGIIEAENCVDLLKLGNFYEHEELKIESFKEVRKIFADKNLTDKSLDDFEELIRIIEE